MVKAALDALVMEPCTIPLGAAVDSCMVAAAGKIAEDTVLGSKSGDVFQWAPFYGLSVGSGDKG